MSHIEADIQLAPRAGCTDPVQLVHCMCPVLQSNRDCPRKAGIRIGHFH